MKNKHEINSILSALLLATSYSASAEWAALDSSVDVSQSSARYVRAESAYIAQVKATNNSENTISGPFRVLIENASLNVKNADGLTEDGVPYFDFLLDEIAPGAAISTTVSFEYARRTRLSFAYEIQNNASIDADSDGVNDDIDQCPATGEGEDVDDAGCALIDSDSGWALVWRDEFNGNAIDDTKWTHEVNCDGGGNNEKQCYTASSDNAYLENGVLKIVAKPESDQALPYSSARLISKEKGDWTYGRFEIRAKAPSGQGAWPAIWMLPTDWKYGGWPHSGEIDIFEAVNLGVPLDDGQGSIENKVHGTLHYGKSWPNNAYSGHSYTLPDGENPADDFHVYAVEWQEGEIRWYVDGVLYQTQLKSEVSYNSEGQADGLVHKGWFTEENGENLLNNAPFDERFHLLLNFAVGGNWPEAVNQGGIDASAFDGQNSFDVDYVRVFECSVSPSTGEGCATVTDNYLDPKSEGGTLINGAAPAPTAPSDGIARDLIIFEDDMTASWPAWDCCGGTNPNVVFDEDVQSQVIEFTVGGAPTVLGFNTNVASSPSPFDASPIYESGVLEFDLKLVTAPNNAAAGWNVKVEQGNAATAAQVSIATPTETWQHYSIPVKTLSDAGLNLNGIDIVMLFPDWGQGEGAVFRVDNLRILQTPSNGADNGEVESNLPAFDFEPEGLGAGLNWNVFENSDNPPLEFVANPDTSGINSSSRVAKITARVDGAPWVGTEIQHGQITPFTLDESNSIVKMMVYKSVISDVGVKFAIASGGAQGEIKVANTKVNEWEELTFDFSGYIGLVETIDIDQIIVFPDFATRTQDNVVYFDNIRLTNGDDVITPQGWNLVWSDEFSGTSIDQNKWTHEVNCDGGGNNEKQCYTASSDNSFVENGVLNIVAKAAANQALPYSSARLISKNQGDWIYGRFEIRAKAPSGQGAWPAIWMLPTDQIYGGWPHSGEIDIFEAVNLGVALNDDGGNVESYVHGTLHYGQSWPNNDSSGHSYLLPDGENPADDFHVYAIEWEEGEIRWYVDGVLYETQRKSTLNYNDNGDANGLAHRGWYTEHSGDTLWNNAPFDERFHLLLNFAVGGSWPEAVNQGGVDASAFDGTNRFLIDYVRVYECANSPSNGLGCATITEGYGDSVENGGTLINGAAPIPVPESDGIARDLLIFDDAINPQWPAWDCCGDSNPVVVFDADAQSQVVEFTVGATPTVLGFNTNFADVPSPFDASPIEANGTLEFDLKLVTPTHNASAAWNLKVEQGGASTEAVVTLATPTPQWQHYSIEVAALKQSGLSLNGIDVVMIFPDWGQGEGAVFRVDNMQFLQGEDDGSGDDGGNNGDDGGTDPVVGDELVANGSFENGSEGWIGDVSIVEDTTSADGNHVFQADIAMAGNPWDVNLSQVMTLTSGATYTVTFKAKASKVRDMLVGLGLNHDPWTNVTQNVGLTTDWQNYTFTLTANGFGDDNSRVFFDLGADNGVVQIDDVSVVQVETTGGDNGGPVEQEFVLISSTDETDIDFLPSTVGEWSTGTTIQSDVMFDGLLGWELTSSSNSPEQGNWGTVLAFQNGINGDFSLFNRIELTLATTGHFAGGYKIAISANGVNKEISLPVNESISTWQSIVLDMADIPLNLSQVDWIAVYGIGGQSGVSQIHLTDFSLLKSAAIEFDSNTENDFVFISSDASVSSDLIVDNDNYSDAGNVIFGEWSTGTMISSTQYAGLNGLRLAANGSWGAVLALQGDISDGVNIDNYDVDFSQYTNLRFKAASQGAFERYAVSIVSKIGDGEVAQEVGFTLANQADWNEIDIDLAMYGVNLSHVSQIAIFGVYQGGSASQSLYITDLVMYDTGKVAANSQDSSDDKFVFFSSTGEDTDMVFDGDDSAHNGNMTISEWSTGTTFNSEVIYNGLSAFQLIRGSASWGAVLALMGDIYGDVQEYSIDVAQYKTLNFKIAAQGGFSEYTLDFVVDGAEHKIPLTVNSNWRDVTIDLADVPLNLSKLTQIAIFGVGGGQGNSIYITDMNLSQ
ncbi:MAG: glucan endo-1,3-beta-D-glucosidase [Alteromonadaceae bacterium]|nr:glucan endo-1,3-beta-D-glucosidase [Alteromonadaceae bacterium]